MRGHGRSLSLCLRGFASCVGIDVCLTYPKQWSIFFLSKITWRISYASNDSIPLADDITRFLSFYFSFISIIKDVRFFHQVDKHELACIYTSTYHGSCTCTYDIPFCFSSWKTRELTFAHLRSVVSFINIIYNTTGMN